MEKEITRVEKVITALLHLFLFFIIYVIFFWESEQETQPRENKSGITVEEAIHVSDNNLSVTIKKEDSEYQVQIAERANKVIKMLKDVYNIDIEEEKHNYNNYFQMETTNESIEKRVVIDFVAHTANVFTNSNASSEEYLASCSAIFMTLTGIKDRDLSEQTLLQMFDDVGQVRRERTSYTSHKVEVTIEPDNKGLLGCQFYKNLRDD